jgi:predicted transcriptional regulator of viral defense system
MKFGSFIQKYGCLPVIQAENLLAGVLDPSVIQVQISRWEKAGKIIQLKRGVYMLAEPYRKVEIFHPYIASILKNPSYVSLEKALEFHHLIPEAVRVYTSLTTKRPGEFSTPIGAFHYQHIQTSLFWGYESVTMNNQTAFIACPEKALLDLFYLKETQVTMEYLMELRLQNLEGLSVRRFLEYAKRFGKPRILKAAQLFQQYLEMEQEQEKTL